MSTKSVSNSEEVIDSRDVIARIQELHDEIDNLREVLKIPETVTYEQIINNELEEEFYTDDLNDIVDELKPLEAVADEGESSPDWQYGETLIRDSYFEDYARELADDIGAVDDDAHWPNDCIDWEKAAEELQQDYMSIDYDGVTYWIHA